MKGLFGIFSNHFFFYFFVFLGAFLLRLCYGLCSPFWGTDEKQIYLLGLKYYTTGDFPYYGPDVVYTQSQIPGALQGILVGLPLYLLPIPEAPFILLNLLNTSALLLFAYYLSKRISKLSSWLIYVWLLTAPWTLNYSTHIINPSYVLPAAILFFIAVFELLIFYQKPMIRPHYAFSMMGFSLLWIMQIHMSFVLLIPYVLFPLWRGVGGGYGQICENRKNKNSNIKNILYFLLGASISGSLLLPTYLQYGILQGTGSIEANVVLNFGNLKEITAIITRFLSFSSFEVGTFIGYNLESRLQFLQQYPWFAPFIVLLTLAGFLQIGYLIVSFWSNQALQTEEGKRVKYFTLLSLLLVYFSFLFSIKGPSPHTFYVILPVSMLYAFFCWQDLWEKPFWRKVTSLMLILGICFHLHLAHSHFHHHSLYKNRTLPQKAIDQKNYKILGNRRSEDWECCY